MILVRKMKQWEKVWYMTMKHQQQKWWHYFQINTIKFWWKKKQTSSSWDLVFTSTIMKPGFNKLKYNVKEYIKEMIVFIKNSFLGPNIRYSSPKGPKVVIECLVWPLFHLVTFCSIFQKKLQEQLHYSQAPPSVGQLFLWVCKDYLILGSATWLHLCVTLYHQRRTLTTRESSQISCFNFHKDQQSDTVGW